MCTISMIGDNFSDRWRQYNEPDRKKFFPVGFPNIPPVPQITKQEFDDLKKEVLIMKELLIKALEYDKKNNEPHCEMEEKVVLLKKVAEMVGISLEEVFPVSKDVNPYGNTGSSTK